MVKKLILISVLVFGTLFVSQSVFATHPAEDGAANYGLFQCSKKGSGDTCRTAWPNNDSNFYQAYKVDGKPIRYEGFGSFGKAGGRASVTACFTQYNIMFEDGAICWYVYPDTNLGDTNNKIITIVDSWGKAFGEDNTNPYNFISLSVFVNDASVFMEGGSVYGRRVKISQLSSDKASIVVNDTFTVTWQTENAFLASNLTWSGPIEKIPGGAPENIAAGTITFKAIGTGTATFNLSAVGPGIFQQTSIKTGEDNPADPDQPGTLTVNITSQAVTAPPPPGPTPTPGPFNLSGSCTGNTQANLSWTTSTNAASYRAERRIWTTGAWQFAANTTATSFSEPTTGTEDYYYRVFAQNSQGSTLSTPSELFVCGSGGAPPPQTCQDPNATNFGGSLPCTYPAGTQFVDLNVTTSGSGTVTSNDGQTCNSNLTCVWKYPLNSTPELAAAAAPGWAFSPPPAGWSGECGTIQGNICFMGMTKSKSVTATFTTSPPPSGTGTISITSKELNTGNPVNTDWTLFYGGSIVNQETNISSKTYTNKPAGQYDLRILPEGTTHVFDHFDIAPANQFLNSGGTLTYTIWYRKKTAPIEVPTCSPSSQSVEVGQLANFNAGKGDGTYSWSAPGGSPPSGTSATFSASYSSSGTKTVTVSSAGQSASCAVNVSSVPPGKVRLIVHPQGSGSGTVKGSNINCGSVCQFDYNFGEAIGFSHTESPGSTWGGWSGACTDFNNCVIDMRPAGSVKDLYATFNSLSSSQGTGNIAVTTTCNHTYTFNRNGQPTGFGAAGNFTFRDKPTGQYQIIWEPIPVTFVSPAETQTLTNGQTITFNLTCSGGGGGGAGGGEGTSTTAEAVCTVSISNPPANAPSSVNVSQPDYCVSGPAATVNWTYSDPSGSPQSAYQVQIDDQGSFNSPEWDSAKISCSGCRSNSTTQGVLQFNTTYKARVRVWNQNDTVSNWAESGSWKTPPHAYPQADFTFANQAPGQQLFTPNSPIQFTDRTTFFDRNPNGRRWSWLFGDNTSSTQQNPVKSYTNEGNYNITLIATDNANQSCSISKPINIQKPNPIWKEVNPGG